MLIIDLIETSIDIDNIIENIAIPDYLLHVLKDRFERRCYANKYIWKVLSIEKQSHYLIGQTDDPNVAHVNVIFKAECISYYIDELVTGFKVLKNDEKIIIAVKHNGRDPMAIASIEVTPQLKSIAKDQIIPIKIITSQYTLGLGTVACVANFQCKMYGTDYYQIIAGKGSVPQSLVDRFRQTKPILNYEKFKFLLPPGKNAGTTIEELLQTPPTLNTILGRQNVNLLQPVVDIVESAESPKKCSAANAVILLIENYLACVNYMNEMLAQYEDEKLYKEHANLWKILSL